MCGTGFGLLRFVPLVIAVVGGQLLGVAVARAWAARLDRAT